MGCGQGGYSFATDVVPLPWNCSLVSVGYLSESWVTGGAVVPLNPWVIMPGLQTIALWIWPSCQVASLSTPDCESGVSPTSGGHRVFECIIDLSEVDGNLSNLHLS